MPDNPMPRIAVDIGGTFTDVAIDLVGNVQTAKTLTTHENPVTGVLSAIGYALDGTGLTPGDFGSVIHGTTLATNALIERRGAKVGVLVTEGFRDILEIGYERRYDQYDINIEKQDFLVPRDLMFAVSERTTVSGEVLTPLDPDSVERAVDAALAAGVESIAICFLHSYKNPAHEQAALDIVRRRAPAMNVSLSSDVSPEVREFDRMCTTVSNAYIKPLMSGYLKDLDRALKRDGYDCPLFIVTSGGGITGLDTAMAYPIRLVESGPSGGAILAAKIAAQRGIGQTVSFDMGGTTAKICLIDKGVPKSSRSFEIDRAARFMKGSGIPVRIPVIEMIEIGAGGGSIAGVDGMGRLRVGPKSASSDPGPACYDRGGSQPTVTDADVAAGYIDPDAFAEGRLSLNPGLSHAAIQRDVAGPLGLSAEVGADGISQTVDEAMANAARMHAVEQGKNLADCTMIAFGGNGPLHATRIAEKIGVREIIVPPDPSVGSAIGFLSAPVSYEIVRSFHALTDEFPFDGVSALLTEMETTAGAIVRAGAPGQDLTVRRVAFMRYRGQGHEIEIAIPPGPLTQKNLSGLLDAFEAEYARLFSRSVPDLKIEVMNWSVTVSTKTQTPAPIAAETVGRTAVPSGARTLTLGQDARRVAASTYRRLDLKPGDRIPGPALIVEPQTTTFVSEAFDAAIDGAGNIVMTGNTAPDRLGRESAGDQRSAIEWQVMWDRLIAIVEEQGQVLMRTAFSPMVRECGDISAGIFDLDGNMLAQAVTGTPGHINTMAMAVREMLPHFPVTGMSAGDVYMTNDPWIGSGHLNDALLMAPIFHDEKVVAISACTSHLYDLGGLGMGPDGSDVFDEGLFLPPMKLVDRGTVNRLIIDIIKANSRSPVSNEGDIYALIACCDVAGVRLSEMLREFRLADMEALGSHILTSSLRATEDAIRKVPNGTYVTEMMSDGYDFEIKLKATMTVTDTEILTDFAGSSGHSAKGINNPIKYAEAYGVFVIRCLIAPDIPNNAGSLSSFKFTAPKDCILNAQYPAPVAMRHNVGHLVADLMLGCLHQAIPGIAPAEGASCLWDIPIRSAASAAREGQNATPFATEFSHSGGMGARPTKDGLSATAFPSGLFGTQSEIAESEVPVRILKRELIRDSGGAGKFRGGLGQRIEMESAEAAPILLFAGVERTKYPARGREGGKDGALGRITLSTGEALRGKGEQPIPAGSVLYWETPGGAGYGDPMARDLSAVERDLELGLISREAATRDYGLVFAIDGTIDRNASCAARMEGGTK